MMLLMMSLFHRSRLTEGRSSSNCSSRAFCMDVDWYEPWVDHYISACVLNPLTSEELCDEDRRFYYSQRICSVNSLLYLLFRNLTFVLSPRSIHLSKSLEVFRLCKTKSWISSLQIRSKETSAWRMSINKFNNKGRLIHSECWLRQSYSYSYRRQEVLRVGSNGIWTGYGSWKAIRQMPSGIPTSVTTLAMMALLFELFHRCESWCIFCSFARGISCIS